jgi:hypothetical protein
MPNAMDPTAAQINITKFNKSVIDPAFIDCAKACNGRVQMPKVVQKHPSKAVVILSENPAALTLDSIDQ